MVFNIFGAVAAAVAWLSCSLLLLLLSDGFTFSVKLVATHVIGDFSILIVGLLILIDVALDTYVIGNPDGLLQRWPKIALGLFLMCTIGVALSCAFAQFIQPNFNDADIFFAGVSIFLLFLIRTASYVKVRDVLSLDLSAEPQRIKL